MERTEREENISGTRRFEWFVPKFRSAKLRTFIGLLFLPYTGMVLSFSVIGSMIANPVHWDRVLALVVIYSLGLGVAAHALDALGSKRVKPWENAFTKAQLWIMAISSLLMAYLIAIYYMALFVPFLGVIALCEGFFVFAYNLEWFRGRFHTDRWFSFSWGFLPVLAGYMMQTNRISMEAVILAAAMAFFSTVEIKASRPYRDLKRSAHPLRDDEKSLMLRYEVILKSISAGIILLGAGLLIWRGMG